ncbi:MAG: UDP-N-acetylmuramoyl-L-alanyl-D-glutamate--2,6-diaminopimelate ligase [Desulfobacteraceae bacterium 4572_35.1]|nr:MAG: UDP-N-acetylmuramoyl-L-alanyl-D-glutamate--2,6-diaminopimelate ligase [Desulfobacteraceae bacterium 4572_35.1]
MELVQLLDNVTVSEVSGDLNIQVSALHYDSRQVESGDLFFALPGAVVDGHDYINAAINNGAMAVVAQHRVEVPPAVTLVIVDDARLAMARMAAAFYAYPARDLLTIGITGTNGKTTMTYLVESLMRQAGYNPVVIGTVSNHLGEEVFAASHTTPESLDLQRMLAEFRQMGADALIIEVSSHALMQSRICGLNFAVTVFTNLTPEHLDYHKNMESYFAAKARLFTDPAVAGSAKAVINSDDPYGAKLLTMIDGGLSVGSQPCADVYLRDFSQSVDGIEATLITSMGEVEISSPLVGRFNMENLSCAVGVGVVLGLSLTTIEQGLALAHNVPGRLERVENDRDALIVVDYAHTGDALEKVLQTLVALRPRRIITVFGCGGDRDRSKRSVMAAVAARYSQLVIITADNPRTEDPEKIIADICNGIPSQCDKFHSEEQFKATDKRYIVLDDRAQAIEFAVNLLQSGDLLLVAGKGHEDYQIIGTTRIHFDDREQICLALKK